MGLVLEDSDCVKFMQVGLSVCGPSWFLGVGGGAGAGVVNGEW